jgi:hypothetical protein
MDSPARVRKDDDSEEENDKYAFHNKLMDKERIDDAIC